MNPFDTFLVNPILNLLIGVYSLLHTLHIPGALGLSIIILSAGIRLVLWPLTSAQLRSTQKMAALKPHLDRIKAEHGHDKVRHQQEVSKLYKEHGVNPLASCLPLLLQLPVFIGLYNVLNKALQFNSANFISSINSHLYLSSLYLTAKPDTSFLGISLSTRPNEWAKVGIFILVIPLLTGALQLAQSKMMAPQGTPGVVKKKDGKENEDTMAQVQSQMTYLMPAMIAFISYGFAFGLSLYWNTFTIIGIIQQYLIMGPGALNKYLPKKLQKQP